MVLKPGWLNRQFDEVQKTVDTWPNWMKRAAGVSEVVEKPNQDASPGETNGSRNGATQERLALKL